MAKEIYEKKMHIILRYKATDMYFYTVGMMNKKCCELNWNVSTQHLHYAHNISTIKRNLGIMWQCCNLRNKIKENKGNNSKF